MDGQTGAKLKGAEFSIYKDNVEYVGSYTTDLNGGIKTWNDNNDAAGSRPSSIKLHLFANGVEVGTTQATANTNWQYTFGAQPVNGADGKAIVYSLSEDEVSGYNTEISEPVTADNAMVINVTNTYRTVATTAAGIATGDDSNMALYGLLSLIAGAGLVGLFMRRRLF